MQKEEKTERAGLFIKMAEEIDKVKGEKKKAGGTIIGETTKN